MTYPRTDKKFTMISIMNATHEVYILCEICRGHRNIERMIGTSFEGLSICYECYGKGHKTYYEVYDSEEEVRKDYPFAFKIVRLEDNSMPVWGQSTISME